MKFRTRLLILLLTVTLLPLGLSFLSQRTSILHFGNKLAGDTRALLNDNAVTLLHALVDDYGRILERDKAMALLALEIQAQAVRTRLNGPPPDKPEPIYFSADYASPQRQPGDLVATRQRLRPDPDGHLTPIPVSFNQQVFFLAGDLQPAEVKGQLDRLSTMVEVYRRLHVIQPDLFLWQYTALESGIHSSYPGKGGYPADYDPRQRQWYRAAVEAGEPTQEILTDLTTGTLIMTLAKPVMLDNGELAGVTALDIDYRQFFSDWKIPAEWGDAAESMVLVYHGYTGDPAQQLEILLRNRHEQKTADWRMPVEREYLEIPDDQLRAIQRDFVTGTSAVRKVTYQDRETLWAYGSRQGEEPFPLVIVPYQAVLAQAVNAEHYVNQQIATGLTISLGLTILAVAAAILLAIVRSRKVTEPVLQLSNAAEELADGNFDAKVDIRTCDELQNLGDIFNGLGERLKEREQMKQSLALAKEIQQELLPTAAPQCAAFDMAGRSLYCDETGGDYYDFINLETGESRRYGVTVGDVSGHGIGAALVMAAARGILRSLTDQDEEIQLARLCNHLNRHLARDTADNYFMTLFYGVLEPERLCMNWISAGHAPLFLYQNGSVRELDSSGIPLGVVETAEYDLEPEIRFQPGDILLIGTDGLWETQNPAGAFFGTDRVAELLEQYAADSAAQLVERLVRELDDFRAGRPADDDITLMVIKAR